MRKSGHIFVLAAAIITINIIGITHDINYKLKLQSIFDKSISKAYGDKETGDIYLTKQLDVYKDTINEYYWLGNTIIYGNLQQTNLAWINHIDDIANLSKSGNLRFSNVLRLAVELDTILIFWAVKDSIPTTSAFIYRFVIDKITEETINTEAINITGNDFTSRDAIDVAMVIFYGEKKEYNIIDLSK